MAIAVGGAAERPPEVALVPPLPAPRATAAVAGALTVPIGFLWKGAASVPLTKDADPPTALSTVSRDAHESAISRKTLSSSGMVPVSVGTSSSGLGADGCAEAFSVTLGAVAAPGDALRWPARAPLPGLAVCDASPERATVVPDVVSVCVSGVPGANARVVFARPLRTASKKECANVVGPPLSVSSDVALAS